MSDEREMERDERRLAEVVTLYPKRDTEDEDAPVATKEREGWCAHRRVTLDEELHRVECRDCGREVDPFAVLLRMANEWQRYASHRKEATRRANAAHERLEELLRLERNARARLRRIDPESEKQAPPRPWGARML